MRDALLEQYPFLPIEAHGIALEDLSLRDDDEFVKAEQEHARLAAQPACNVESLCAAERRISECAEKLADEAAAEEAALRERLPFVEVGKVPLRAMGLESCLEFAELLVQYEVLAKDSVMAEGPEAKRLEKAMNDLAQLRAYDEAAALHCAAVREADLHERFPFLPEEPVPGVSLVEAGVMSDSEFRTLANALLDLRRSPEANPEALRAAEEALADRAAEVAASKQRATEEARVHYPFLSRRVAGVLLCDLPLARDALFQELMAQRAPLLEEPEANAEPLRAVEDQLRSCAAGLADAKKKLDAAQAADNNEVRAHNPFLPHSDVRGVPLRELDLMQDAEYADKWLDRLRLMEHPEENQHALEAVEDALRDRAEERARDKLRAEDELLAKHPFVVRPAGAPLLASLGVPVDEQFQQLSQEHAALAREPVRNALPLRAVAAALQARVVSLAAADAQEALRPAEATRALVREHLMCVPYMHPDVPKDSMFSELAEKRDALLSNPERNATPLRAVEEAMHERAVWVAAQRKRRTRPEHLTYKVQIAEVPGEKAGEVREVETDTVPFLSGTEVQIAEVPGEKAGEVREVETDTVPFLSGTEVRDPYYEELAALRASLVEEDPKTNANTIRAVEKQMNDRAVQLHADGERAVAVRERMRDALLEQYPFLPIEAHGIALEDLSLRDDDEFVKAEQEHARLAAQPACNVESLCAAERRISECAEKLADEAAAEEAALRERLPFVEVGKVPLRAMGLESCLEFAELLVQYEVLAKDSVMAEGPEAKRLEKAMNDLAQLRAYDEAAALHCAAVREADLHERFPFLPEEPVPGVSLVEAGVMSDSEFRTLANALLDLRRSPEANPEALRAAEEALADRAAEVAASKQRATEEARVHYPFLSRRVAGVLLCDLPLARDALFQELMAQRAPLLEEPEANAEPLRAVEDQLRSCAAGLADAKKKLDAAQAADNNEVRAHNPFLPHSDVRGVPLRELDLMQDAEYADKWLDRLRLMEHPEENQHALEAVEDALRDRAEERARDKLRAEDELLAKHPFVVRPAGAPLLASLGVPVDEQFQQLSQEHAALAREPVRNALPLRAVAAALQARVVSLAAADAQEALRPAEATRALVREHLMCVPYMHPDVPKDSMFSELAEKRDALLSNPERNATPLRAVEEAMHERAVWVAAQRKRRTRPEHLTYKVQIAEVPGEKAGEVREVETDTVPFLSGTEVQIAEVPGEKAGEVREVETDTVPFLSGTEVRDPYYEELAALRASLVKEDETGNADGIRCVEEQMKDRVAQLNSDASRAQAAQKRAEAALQARYPFLGPTVTGEMLTAVGLEDDAVFVGLATEYAALKAAPTTPRQALASQEQMMRARASELVAEHACEEEALRRLMPFVGPLPGGVMLRELDMANDPDVKPLLTQLEELAKDLATVNGPEVRRLEKAIGELVRRSAEDEAERQHHRLVDADGLHERFPFLPEEPVPGVSLVEAGVMSDSEFCTLANALLDLRRGPKTSLEALRAAEEALADRAAEVAASKQRATEEARVHYPFLSRRVAGVLLCDLPLARDALFQELMAQRAPLLGSPRTNAARLRAIEAHAQDRVRELASVKKQLGSLRDAANDEVRARNPFLPHSDVRGVPLRELGLMRNPEYAQLMDHRLRLKERPVENEVELTAVEARLKERATEVANAVLVTEATLRAKYATVAVSPEAALLSSLALTRDPRVAQLEQQCAALACQPQPNREALRLAEEAAAARVQELVDEDAAAEVEAARARAAVLKQYPMCVRDATEAIGKDAMFASLAAQHAALLSDPAANRTPLADVEDLMRERGSEVESGRRQRRRRRPAHISRLLDMNDIALEGGALDDYHGRRHRHRRSRILDARDVPLDAAGEVHEQQDETTLPPRALHHNDPYYRELAALRASLVKEDETGNADGIRCVEEQMKDRVAQLNSDASRAQAAQKRAEAALQARYPFLGPTVTGEMLTAVGLEDDAVFVGLATEYAALKAAPTTPRQALASQEQMMRARASELVAEHACEEEALRRLMPFVGPLPGGVMLRELDMANDPDVKPLLTQLEELAKDLATVNGPEVRRLEKAIGELVRRSAEDEAERQHHRLVDADGLHERFPFLPEEPVPGVSLVEADVVNDSEFCTLANALLDLRRGPKTSLEALRAAEEALASRAAEVAASKQRATEEARVHYPFLSRRVAGVLLCDLPLARDALFQELMAQRAPLLGSPRTNAARLRAIEAHAQDRVRELASVKKQLGSLRDAANDEVRARNPFLPHSDVRGVPLRELGLMRNPEYAQLMDHRLRLKERPVENEVELTAVEARLKERATEVANAVLVTEATLRAKYATVAVSPEAALLSSLALTRDPRVAQLEQQCAALACQPQPNREALRLAEEAAAARVQELVDEDAAAEVEAARARAAVLKQYPMCVRDATEAIGKDAMFASLAAQHAALLSDPAANRTPLADVEDLMRERGSEVESGRRQRRRRRPAHISRLLDMNDIALEGGALDDYHGRRHRHRRSRILDARDVPLDAAGEVHEQQDETTLPPRALHHNDPYYRELAALRASLVKEDETGNADGIRCVEEQMKDRVAQLNSDASRAQAAQKRAEAALQARYPFLGPTVTGEMLTAVGLEDDAVFVGLATEYAALKAAPTTPRQALASQEQMMRARASELVAEHACEEEALRRLMPFVGPLPGGVMLRELDMANDPDVKPLLTQLEELAKDLATVNGPEVRRLEKAIGELVRRSAEDEAERQHHRLVDADGLHERFPFLPEEPVPGVSLVEAGVMSDSEFCTLANALLDLRRGPKTSLEALRAAEEALADRAAEVAASKQRATEEARVHYPFLSRRVAGVLLCDLPLARDALFQELMAQRAPLLGSPRTNAARLRAIEAHAQDRVRELASVKKQLGSLRDAANDEVRARNPFLPHSDVRGVPLRELGLMRNPEYAQLMDHRLRLKERPVENEVELTAVEARLKERATEVANAVLVTEATLRAKYATVAVSPEAALLSSLALTRDPRVAQLEQQCAALACQPQPNREALRLAEEAAAARVQELVDEDAAAEVEAARARAAVLKQYPMCVRDATEAIGKDAMFASLAAQHAALLSDPAANRTPLADVEDLMRERGSEVESGRRQRRRRRPAHISRLLDMNDIALEGGALDDYHGRRHRHRRSRILDARDVPLDAAGEVHEQQDETTLPPRSRGVTALHHNDPYYRELAALRASLVKEDETGNADGIRCVEEQMKDRVAQLNSDASRAQAAQKRAEAALQARYPFLGPTVTGEMLTAVGLEDDAVFVGLATEYAALKAAPTTPRQALASQEQMMRARASELVAEHACEEEALRRLMPFVGPLPGGVMLRELDMANDPDVKPLLTQLEELAKDLATVNGPEVRRLEKAIGELVRRSAEDEAERQHHRLVDADGLHERFPFLPEEPVPGVSLVEAGVMSDSEFCTLANALLDLRRGPKTSLEALRAAEEALASRAAEVAASKQRATEEARVHYPFLSRRVAGVLLCDLPLARDALFQELMAQRAPLLGSPRTNAARLRAIEAHAQDRVRELASVKKQLGSLRDAANDEVRARNPFLPHSDVRGVPLRELGLMRNPEYAQLMDHRLRLKERPVENEVELTAVEARLKERATEVANAVLVTEATLRAKYATVAVSPEAALLSSLALTRDPRVAQLEQQCAALACQPQPNREALRLAEEAAAARVQELVDEDAAAEVEAARARAAVLKQYPMCVRDATEAIGKDAMFASLAAQHAALLSDPAANRTPLADVEDLMRERGSEVESGRRQRRRRRPAHISRLLDMNDIALEGGALDDYHGRRHRHRRSRILDARDVPLDAAGEVHEQQDETTLPPRSRGVTALHHNDPYYRELAALRASLVKEDETGNADGIRCVEEQMKDRVAQLNSDASRAQAAQKRAEAALQARYPFLGPTVTGEMLTAVGLEDDAVFVGLATEYAALKAAPTTPRQALASQEQMMRARASELVAEHACEEEALRRLMPFVGPLPGGVMLRELDMANDPDVKPLLTQLEELAKDLATVNGPEVRRLEKAIGELVRRSAEDEAERQHHRLVDADGLHERFPFLPEEPVPGVSLVEADVVNDPEFRTLANALLDLRRGPKTSLEALRAAEEALASRAAEVAASKQRATEEARVHYPFLSRRVAGVLLCDLPLARDALFQELMAQRAPLLGSPRTNAARLRAIEAHAQDRVRELASVKKQLGSLRDAANDEVRARNPFLPHSDVRGVPLRELGLMRNPEYAQLMDHRLRLKERPVENEVELTAVEARLKERATEVANAVLVTEATLRAKYATVAVSPEAALLSSLALTRDPRVAQLEQQCAALACQPQPNREALRLAEEAAAARVQELVDEDAAAEVEAARARAAVLKQYPMCVRDATEAIGKDAMFASLAAQHAALLSDPAANRTPLADVEDLMRERGSEVESGRRQRRRRRPAHISRLLDMNDIALEGGALDDYHGRRHRHRRSRILDARDVPLDAAGEVHEQQDETTLPPRSRGVTALHHNDPYYRELAALRASLVKEDETGNADGIRCVEEQMKDRVAQLNSDASRAQAAQKRAEAALQARYPFLGPTVTGEMLTAVGLEDDAVFVGLATEYAALKAAPTTPRQALASQEQMMRARASELVAEHACEEEALRRLMPFVGPLPGGVMLRELDMANDPDVKPLLTQLEELAKDLATVNGPEVRRLEKAIGELVRRSAEDEAERQHHRLVDADGLHERFPFLPEEPVPGVSLVEADVVNDPEFRTLANALLDLRRGPKTSLEALRAAEEALASRAAEVAASKQRATEEARVHYPFLSRRVAGVLLCDLPLARDALFQELMAQRAPLLGSPRTNAARLRAIEAHAQDRVRELASVKKQLGSLRDAANDEVRARNPFLPHSDVRGVPLRELGLMRNPEYAQLMDHRLRLKERPVENEVELTAVEARLKERATEVANAVLVTEATLRAKYATVAVSPEAALLSSLALTRDPRVAQLEQQCAALACQPQPNREALRLAEEAAAARVQELVDEDAAAEVEAARARAAVLKQYPMCVRDATEAIGKDAMFASLAAQHAALLSDPAANRTPLADVEDLMRERGSEVESGRRQRRRRRPAHISRLLDMNDIALEGGALDDYHGRRHRHRRSRILDARDVPLDAAGEVHEQQDETTLPPRSRGVTALHHNDPYYRELAALRASLVKEDETGNADGIRCVEEQMKDRVAQLNSDASRAQAAQKRAEAALQARYPFLGPTVTGEMLTAVGLEDDAVFVGLATEYAALKAAPTTPRQALASQEQMMRARASELVAEHACEEEALRRLMPFVGPLPGGVMLRELDMANDPDVKPLLTQLEELAKDLATVNGPEVRRLEKAIGELVRRSAEDEAERQHHRLVDADGLHERFPFLPEEPVPGVSLVEADVVNDPEFRTLANALLDLRRGPKTSLEALRAAEEALASRAAEVAASKQRATEEARVHYPFLSRRVAGVLLCDLPLARDALFQELMAQRAPLLGSPRTNAARLRAIEAHAQDRVRELSVDVRVVELFHFHESEAVRARHPYLAHSDVSIVPLREVEVETDRKLQRLAGRRLALKSGAVVDVAGVALVESEMRERVADLAGRLRSAEVKDRRRFLPAHRRSAGVFFAALHIPEDEEIVEWRLDVIENPNSDAEEEVVAKKAMRQRGSSLLDAYMEAEAHIAKQLHRLRRSFPNCVRDVNPSIELDDYLATLLNAYADWVAFMDETESTLVQVQEEILARSVALIGDDRCVADALHSYCVAEAELRLAKAHRQPLAQLTGLRRVTDVAQYKYRLWSRRQARRHVAAPLLSFPEDQGDSFDYDGAELVSDNDTYAAHLRQAHSKACKDSVFLYLQRQKAILSASRNRSGVRCASELLKRRLRQLTGDAARLQRTRQRLDNAILRRYPFLQARHLVNVSLAELRLEEDDVFMRLAAERDRLLKPPSDLRARYPFLPSVVNGVPIEELGLETDPLFMRLASQREDLIGPLRAKLQSVKDREEAMRVRMSERVAAYVAAENHLRDAYPFLDANELPVPLQRLHLEHDVSLQRLYGKYAELRNSTLEDDVLMTGTTTTMVKPGRRSRVSSLASNSSLMSARPHVKTTSQKQLEKQMREWVMRRGEAEAAWEFANMMDLESLADRFPFLPVEPLPGIHLAEIGAHADITFCSRAAEVEEIRKKMTPPEEVSAAEDALLSRVMELSGEKHTNTERCRLRDPRLPRRVGGVLIGDIDVPECNDTEKTSEEAVLMLYHRAVEKVKARRVCEMDEDEAVRSRHPFLVMNDVHGVPLRQLPLSDDPMFHSYMRKWRILLSAEVIDREKLRIYEDLLCESAEEQALRLIAVNVEMANRLTQLQVTDVVSATTSLLDLHNVLVKARDVLVTEPRSGVYAPATVEDRELLACMSKALHDASEDMVQELTALRQSFPWSVWDVNPALRCDVTFQRLETQRLSLLSTFDQMELLESLETEERKRSVELIGDEAYVLDAAKACATSANEPLRRLRAEELTKLWKHQLRLRHRQRRLISFTDIPDDTADVNDLANPSKGRALKARKSRERRKRSMSWTRLDVDVIPDNVFTEIREDDIHTSLPCSASPGEILTVENGVVTVQPNRLQNSHVLLRQLTPNKQQRRQRSQSQVQHRHGSLTAESVPDDEACAMLQDGTIVPVVSLAPAVADTAMPKSSLASSTVTVLDTIPARSAEPNMASGSDAAGSSPRGDATEPRKGKKRVLKKRLRVCRTSSTSIDTVPDETPGELVEHGMDKIDTVAYRTVRTQRPGVSDATAGGAKNLVSGDCHRPLQLPEQRRKMHVRQLPTKPRLAARPAKMPELRTSPKASDAKAGGENPAPVVRTKSQKRGGSRMGSRVLPVVDEVPEVTVGLLRDQESEEHQETPCDTTAAAMTLARRPQLQQQQDGGTTSRSRSKPKQCISRPSSPQRSRIKISQVEEVEVREMHTTVEEKQLVYPAGGDHRRSEVSRENIAAEQVKHSRKSSVAPQGMTPSSARRYSSHSHNAVLLEESQEVAELAAEAALVQRALREAQPSLARAVTQDEVEAGAEPMKYVFEHYDLSSYSASEGVSSALLTTRLRELEELLQIWIVQRSKEAMEPRATTSANIQAVRQSRRLQVATSRDTVENPRQVPFRWARLTAQELDEDTGLRNLMNGAASQQHIADYLSSWSARKQAANEALFARFPFLPTLPSGYALTEVGFTNDAEFQRYARGGAYQESVHVQQQMRDIVGKLARTKAAAAQGRRATRYVDKVRVTVETTRDAVAPGARSTVAQPGRGGGDLTRLVKDAQVLVENPEDQQLLDAILTARLRKTNRFLDKRQRLPFVAQSKQEAERLIKRMMVRMRKEKTSDIPMSMEDVETLRFFFDGVDVDHFGMLDRTDTTDFIMLTLGEEKHMSRTDVERLLFPDVLGGAVLPTLVDFSDFSKFYKMVALQELMKQDSAFDQQDVVTRATTAAGAASTALRCPEPPSASPQTGSSRRGRLNAVSSSALPVRTFASTPSSAAASAARTGDKSAIPPSSTGLQRPSSEPRPHPEGNGTHHTLQHRQEIIHTPPNSTSDRARAFEGSTAAAAAPDRWFVKSQPGSGNASASASTPPQPE
ncbi:hypothetical protein JKF63_06084 [Porcisia hertigi]|uniref:DUF7623 domain-containing protein n=1 Tax=Porcisia hertigi TaxID=2761500 RepID=A0A836LEA8_9TRYP|nr:hypothetical protein JKF63_06084 [Porcisia hertigi]